jgi:hypothetical protein
VPVIPALGRLTEKNHEFKDDSQAYMWDPVSKKWVGYGKRCLEMGYCNISDWKSWCQGTMLSLNSSNRGSLYLMSCWWLDIDGITHNSCINKYISRDGVVCGLFDAIHRNYENNLGWRSINNWGLTSRSNLLMFFMLVSVFCALSYLAGHWISVFFQ